MRARVALGVAVAAGLFVAGCGNVEGDHGGSVINEKTDVLRMPNRVPDVAVTCDGLDAVYTSGGGGVYVVQDSARCGAKKDTG